MSTQFTWDVFVSHASEDKESVARPLAYRLQDAGLRVWFDESALVVGDSLNEVLNSALASSRFGLVLVSSHFIAKKWTSYELNALFALETKGIKRILPVLHGLTPEDVTKFNPVLADRVSLSTGQGLELVANAVAKVVGLAAAPTAGSAEAKEIRELQALVDEAINLLTLLDRPTQAIANELKYWHHHFALALRSGSKDDYAQSHTHLDRALLDAFESMLVAAAAYVSHSLGFPHLGASERSNCQVVQDRISLVQAVLPSYRQRAPGKRASIAIVLRATLLYARPSGSIGEQRFAIELSRFLGVA